MAFQKQFVIISLPRSGSNLLVSMLNTHPNIVCEGELFNLKNIKEKRSALLAEIIKKFPMAYLAKRKRSMRKKNKAVYGFKFLTTQLAVGGLPFISRFYNNNYRFVFLYRKNTIAQILSFAVALQEKKWVVRGPHEYNRNVITLSLAIIDKAIKGITENIQLYEELKKQYNVLEIIYEDDLLNPEQNGIKFAKKIADFFGIEQHSLTAQTLKTDLRSDHERISNLEEFLTRCQTLGYTKEVAYYRANPTN